MDNIFDFRKLPCPQPVVQCKKLIEQEQLDAFTVIVDNAPASENVIRFLRNNGYEVEIQHIDNSEWNITAISTASIRVHTEQQNDNEIRSDEKILVLITTYTLGRGDDILGKKLMGSFLESLPELGYKLWRIILLNGGVKLSAESGSILDKLHTLEQNGVSILVCGTCLSHYSLLDKKQIGETTNMMDIISSLDIATKIIRP
ncbi:MAG: sulfurtransferase-like selenium metabolism protein YedF [Desulfovibrio sp.]|nr:sulfurtransferase-like selenium metabolism protein YedF [Desulfovibrio sp.]